MLPLLDQLRSLSLVPALATSFGKAKTLLAENLIASTIATVSVGYLAHRLLFQQSPSPEKSTKHQDADVIIVGCGVGGAALATTLARDGRKVLVIERSMSFPDRIVGELLQPGGVAALETLGLQQSIADVEATNVKGYAVHGCGRHVTLPYPSHPSFPEQPTGASFIHGKFVQGLRSIALQQPNVKVLVANVDDIIEEDGAIRGVKFTVQGQPQAIARAPLTFIMDGLNSKFRSKMVTEELKTKSFFCGCIIEGCQPFLPQFAEVILTPFAPVLVYPIAPNRFRILVDVPAPLPSIANGALREFFMSNIVPFVPKHVQAPLIHTLNTCGPESECRLRALPCCFLPPAPICTPGAILLGDAFNMRHPLTGGGMTVVLNDIILLREMLKEIPDLSAFDKVVKMHADFHWKRKRNHASSINILAMALSTLFAGSSLNLSYLRTACFEYFESGTSCTDGPMKLLGGIHPSVAQLTYHFYSVGIRSTRIVFRDYPWYLVFPMAFVRAASVLVTATALFVPLVRSELLRPRVLYSL